MEFGQILLWSIAIIVGILILISLILHSDDSDADSNQSDAAVKVQQEPKYNTPVNAQTIRENIGSICRWEHKGDKWHYVVVSGKLHGKYLSIASTPWGNIDGELISIGEIVAQIRIQPLAERFQSADINVSSPIEGVSFFNKQSEYNVRDIIVTIDTDGAIIEAYKETERLKSIRMEQLMTSEVLEWQLREDGLYLMATEALGVKYTNCKLTSSEGVFRGTSKIYEPNEIAYTIIIEGDHYREPKYSFPVVLDVEYVIIEEYVILGRHTSHVPFPILKISTDPTVINNIKQKSIESRKQAMIEAAEREQRERDAIAAKIKERHRLRQLEKAIEMELIDKGEIFKESKRPPIPSDVRDAVYNRDGGKCVECGSRENLHFDHIIPYSKGGATNIENLQILCQKCNLQKSNKIG